MTRKAAITYDGLPISSGGAHHLRTQGFVEGFDALQSFVHGVSAQTLPVTLAIEIISGPYDERFSAPLIARFNKMFGNITFSRGIGDFVGHQWKIDMASLPAVIPLMESERPIPVAGYAGFGAVVHATWDLKLLNPITRQPLPYQEKEDYLDFQVDFQTYLGNSGLYARISEKTTASLFLTFPFEEIGLDAQVLAVEIQKHFPARISSKHWKKWSITKKGVSYVGRKIEGVV